MNDQTKQLINDLAKDLEPSRRTWRWPLVWFLWLLGTAAYVGLATLWLGPFRPGFTTQMLSVPTFTLEMLLGVCAVGGLAMLALVSSIPGRSIKWLTLFACIASTAWLLTIAVGLWWPVLEPSMSGKRDHCVWEAYVYSIPPLLVMLHMQGRRFSLAPGLSRAAAAGAAGFAPAVIMQIACMHQAEHALLFHLAPALMLVVAMVLIGLIWGKRSLPPRP